MDRQNSDAPVVVIAGPTAVGKSSLAMALAESFDLTIVNADAMQLYRGMDIGTAKATEAERQRVPHACLDLLDVTEPATVVAYQTEARRQVLDSWQQGRIPVVVGGSSLYLRALCDELEVPPTDPQVRARYESQLSEVGAARLHERLAQVAPEAAAHIQPTNGRRIVRALEVVELTGEFHAQLPEPVPWSPTLWLGLRMDRDRLDARIAGRVEQMMADGLLAEVRALEIRGLRRGRTASKAVGYAQMLEHTAGRITLAQAQQETVTATRRLARRQERTFRSNRRIRYVESRSEVVDLITEFVRSIRDGQTSRR